MGSNILMFGWNRSIPGREKVSSLDTHGGDLNGFFLVKADPARLRTFAASEEWTRHLMRAA